MSASDVCPLLCHYLCICTSVAKSRCRNVMGCIYIVHGTELYTVCQNIIDSFWSIISSQQSTMCQVLTCPFIQYMPLRSYQDIHFFSFASNILFKWLNGTSILVQGCLCSFPFQETLVHLQRDWENTVIYKIAAGSHYEEESWTYTANLLDNLLCHYSLVIFIFTLIFITGMRNIMDTMEGRRKQESPTILIW